MKGKVCIIFCIELILIFSGVLTADPVTILNIEVVAIRDKSVVIRWDTDISATGQIEYGLTTSYGDTSEEKGLSYWQQIEVKGLTEGTEYHFRLKAKDDKGNETISGDSIFTTRTQTELETLVRAARSMGDLPKVYYVKTDGNNSYNGLSIDSAWQHPSYATQIAEAGDTIYLMDGTWYDEHCVFAHSGIETHPIVITAYSGTPIFDGEDTTGIAIDITYGASYINISNILIKYYSQGIYVREAININLSSIEIHNTLGIAGNFLDCTYCSISDCNIHDNGWNSWMVQTNYYPTHHISISNNEIHDNPGSSGGEGHNIIDLFNYGTNYSISYIDIIDNEIYGGGPYNGALFEHGGGDVNTMYYVNISGNMIHNVGRTCVNYLRNSFVYNNTLYDLPGAGFESYGGTTDSVMFLENTVFNTIWSHVNLTPAGSVTFENNNISYYRINVGEGVVIDPVPQLFSIRSEYGGTVIVQFTSNKVFSENGGNTAYYYTDCSKYITLGNESVSITAYKMTVIPNIDSLEVSIITWDTTGTYYKKWMEICESPNVVTSHTVGDLHPNSTIEVKINNIPYDTLTADSSGWIAFDYTSGFASDTVIFEAEVIPSAIEEAKVNKNPSIYSLSQNFPNPFRSRTEIMYSLPVGGNVEINIYNITGQKVRILVNSNQNSGYYHIIWDGKDDMGKGVGSGIYYYELRTKGYKSRKKIEIIR